MRSFAGVVVTATLAFPPASRILVSSAVVSFQLCAETVSPVIDQYFGLETGIRLSGRTRGCGRRCRGAGGSGRPDLIEINRPEDRHGHVEAVRQVAIGGQPVAVPGVRAPGGPG